MLMTQHFHEDTNTNNTSEINNELSQVNDWLKINKFSLNKSKTKYMISKKKPANKHCKAYSKDIGPTEYISKVLIT